MAGKSSEFVRGYMEAERQMYLAEETPDFVWFNPFDEGSEASRGFEEGYYDFTQK